MKQYLTHLKYIKKNGIYRPERTGTGTLDCFGYQNRYDLSKDFPVVTTKKLFLKGVVHELLWFIKGSTNTKYLLDNNVHIWDEWADKDGELGPVYGKQWRSWPTSTGNSIDQLAGVIDTIKKNPDSRRMLVSAWNVEFIESMALPPCHTMFQFYVLDGKLSCQLYQRSADIFLGVPFNIASYALLTLMIAQVCNLKPGDFVHSFGSNHIYKNHIDQVDLQLSRKSYPKPKMVINSDRKHIDDFKFEDFNFEYDKQVIKGIERKDKLNIFKRNENLEKYKNAKNKQFAYVSHPTIKGAISK